MWESFKPDVKGYKDILTCGSCRSSGRPQLPKLAPRHLIKSYERGCHWRQTRVLLPLFWMRKKRVQVHRNAGNNPCKWRAEEESEQSLEKLREGREKAEIKKCAWAAKYLTMARRLRPGTSTCFFIWISGIPGSFFQAQCCSKMRANNMRLLEGLQFWREITSYFCSQTWWMNASRSLELTFLPLGKKRM